MFGKEELDATVDFLESNFDLDDAEILPGAYYYTCLPLCLLDAVFSIGVRYSSTANAVKNYCKAYDIPCYGTKENRAEVAHSISDLIRNIESVGVEDFSANVVKNSQRTSSRNGILKSEAVLECAYVFQKNGIESLSDFRSKLNDTVENQFKEVKGQNSGISLKYLKMLCGDEDTLKPDRHIIRFLESYSNQKVSIADAELLMREILVELNKSHPALTMRELDYIIWKYQSNS